MNMKKNKLTTAYCTNEYLKYMYISIYSHINTSTKVNVYQ